MDEFMAQRKLRELSTPVPPDTCNAQISCDVAVRYRDTEDASEGAS